MVVLKVQMAMLGDVELFGFISRVVAQVSASAAVGALV